MADATEKQLSLTLTNEQRDETRKVLDYVAGEIDRISAGDEDLAFRIRRYIHARLQLKNRGNVQQREKLRKSLFGRQKGTCALCDKPFTELSGTHVHRTGPGGYTEANCQLVHEDCHEKHHLVKGEPIED